MRAAISVAILFVTVGCAGMNSGSEPAPIAASAPPTIDYDNLIVPGDRIGPVAMGKAVDQIVKQLGNPNHVGRSSFRGPGYNADEITYYYYEPGTTVDNLSFTYVDSGLQPVVESGYRGICTDTANWHTANGLHVGCSLQDVINAYGQPNYIYGATTDKPACTLWYDTGIVFIAHDRNSPVYDIYIVPAGDPEHR